VDQKSGRCSNAPTRGALQVQALDQRQARLVHQRKWASAPRWVASARAPAPQVWEREVEEVGIRQSSPIRWTQHEVLALDPLQTRVQAAVRSRCAGVARTAPPERSTAPERRATTPCSQIYGTKDNGHTHTQLVQIHTTILLCMHAANSADSKGGGGLREVGPQRGRASER
jgi:hypothetical protein